MDAAVDALSPDDCVALLAAYGKAAKPGQFGNPAVARTCRGMLKKYLAADAAPALRLRPSLGECTTVSSQSATPGAAGDPAAAPTSMSAPSQPVAAATPSPVDTPAVLPAPAAVAVVPADVVAAGAPPVTAFLGVLFPRAGGGAVCPWDAPRPCACADRACPGVFPANDGGAAVRRWFRAVKALRFRLHPTLAEASP